MPDKKQRPRKPKKNVAAHPNAVNFTVYDPQGAPVPADVVAEISDAFDASVQSILARRQLLSARTVA